MSRNYAMGVACQRAGARLLRRGTRALVLAFWCLVVAVAMPSEGRAEMPANVQEDPGAIYALAARLYAGGEPRLAAQLYHELLAAGVEETALYYNLAQAYLDVDDLPRAAWALYNAQRLAPRNGQIRAERRATFEKLLLTKSALGKDVALTESFATFHAAVYADAVSEQWITVDEHAVVALVLWLAAGLCVALLISGALSPPQRQRLRSLTLSLGFVCLLTAILLAGRIMVARSFTTAVVVDASVAVRAGPGTLYDARAVLAGGSIVRIVQSRGPWAEIDPIDDDVAGWIRRNAVWQVNAP